MKKYIALLLSILLLLPSCGQTPDKPQNDTSSDAKVSASSEALTSSSDATASSDDTASSVDASSEVTPPEKEQPDDGFYTHLGYTFTYIVNPDGKSCTVTGMIDPKEKAVHLEIPTRCDGYKVTAIGDHAFEGSKFLETVSTSDNAFYKLEEIGEYAFSETNLKRAELYTKHINQYAFYYCVFLESVYGKADHIGKSAFEECRNLSKFVPVTNVIEQQAFYGCKALRSFDFSEIDSLGEGAFEWAGLETLAIGDNGNKSRTKSEITAIPDKAFHDCPLRYVLIGRQIKTVGEYSITLFQDNLGASPQVVIFMEGVETIGSMRPVDDSQRTNWHSGALLYLPSSLKKIAWKDHSYYDGEELKLFYAGNEGQFKKLFPNYPSKEGGLLPSRTTVYFDVEYSNYVYYNGPDWPC